MIIGRWYRQRFNNGDAIYFLVEKFLKNGNAQGTAYYVDVDRPRAKAKAKRESVYAPELWTPITESEVPAERFAVKG